MWNTSIKAEYLAAKIIQAIEAYSLRGADSVLDDAIRELKKQFPSCSDSEITDILGLCFDIYSSKQKESVDLVVTAPDSFNIKTKKTKSVVENLINHADKSIIMTGYSVSDYFSALLDKIIDKSQQGVYVRFYVNDIEKQRHTLDRMFAYNSKYLQLFEFEKQDDKMAASHAKILVVDSKKALVSSANLSYHGLTGNVEMGLLIDSKEMAKKIEELFKEMVRMRVFKKREQR
jgi:phosphatidylserine/phosphatidylglycerophosphate/cardiolipin synthase-like enzyme